MKNISDLQIGKSGEYLVCADLILNGFIAYPSEQGLPYDVVMDVDGILYKVQVKTTRGAKHVPQRKTDIPAYIFHIGNHGKRNKTKLYSKNQVDIFALVALDSKRIAYLPFFNHKTSMNFRVPELRGKYHDEKGVIQKAKVIDLREKGLTCESISGILNMKLSSVYKYSANVDITQKGTNSGVYFDEFPINECLDDIFVHANLH